MYAYQMEQKSKIDEDVITVFIPVLNEEESIPQLISDLKNLQKNLLNERVILEVLIHDNCSTDKSWELICQAKNEFVLFKAFKFRRNIGYQSSLTMSFTHASGAALIVYQCDQQDPMDLILDMCTHWRNGSKCVVGVAQKRNESIKEKIGRYIFIKLLKSVSDLRINFWFTDFYLLDKSLYRQLIGLPIANQFIRGYIVENFKIDSYIPYTRIKRAKGISKFKYFSKYSLAFDALLLHSNKLLRRINFTTVIISVFSLILGVIICVNFFFKNESINLLIAISSTITILIGTLTILLLGLILEFIIRIYKKFHSIPDHQYFNESFFSEILKIQNSAPGNRIR
jgi:glycosyltransferase involved in cell wall biosynthesis